MFKVQVVRARCTQCKKNVVCLFFALVIIVGSGVYVCKKRLRLRNAQGCIYIFCKKNVIMANVQSEKFCPFFLVRCGDGDAGGGCSISYHENKSSIICVQKR